MTDWLPIQTAPEEKLVLLAFDDVVTVGMALTGCWSDELEDGDPIFPSHWMPLPPPLGKAGA